VRELNSRGSAEKSGRAHNRLVRVVVQRVSEAGISIEGEAVAAIGPGLLVLVGIGRGDVAADIALLANKVLHLRIFSDAEGQMNRAVGDAAGEILVVSQFTLFGDCRKGRRPSYAAAALPVDAQPLYEEFVARLRTSGLVVREGVFGAMMQVRLVNDGPVTLLLDSRRGF
jgi:D-aminoacyl-tRNA deacylase